MAKIVVQTKGRPFREGSHREKYWDLLLRCKTDEEYREKFNFKNSATWASVLRWLVKAGHIRLV